VRTQVSVTVDGTPVTAAVEPRKLLSDFLREDAGVTGARVGCEHGVCGACTVALDGRAVRSCLLFAVQADGAVVETVEGLAGDGRLDALQQAFRREHALQCGFCTPGFLVSILKHEEERGLPPDVGLSEVIGGNLCRCTGYVPIAQAVRSYRASRESGR